MEVITQNDEQPAVFHIEGECTIYRAAELKESLFAALEASTLLEIDLSAVSEIDTAGMQILLLAKKTARIQNKTVRLVACSEAVLEVVGLWGMGSYLTDSPVLPSGAGISQRKH